jgi:hypothetical protein
MADVGDVFEVPVSAGQVALAQVVVDLGGNVLLAVFLGLWASGTADLAALDEPIFLAETMDLRIQDGSWPRLGNRVVAGSISVPDSKVWIEPPGEYRRQGIDGTLGEVLSPAQARTLSNHRSFSPALIEAALRGLHGFGPWLPAFDQLAAP